VFADTARFDPRVGRIHLEVLEGGRSRCPNPIRRVRAGIAQAVEAQQIAEIRVGDELWLTLATRLRALR